MTEIAAPGGVNVTATLADLVESNTLVAVTVAVAGAVRVAGAVYTQVLPAPAATLPGPEDEQIIAVLVVLATVAVNDVVWPWLRLAVAGVRVTPTCGESGITTLTECVPVGSAATVVAVRVTEVGARTLAAAGAV